MASSITEEDIKKLREARYLTAEISHRLPAQGQVIPTPEPNESVVFVSHFLRGLGFSLDPFVRGLMFYYGLDFHDLAPHSILHISSFIIVCEAFLRVTPHFGLWLKTFNVKPKMIDGRHAECGGAIISKGADAPWPKGSFPEVSNLWQRKWFYITAPRSKKWAAAPAFRSAPPPQLASWINKGLDWGPVNDVLTLQSRIQDLLKWDVSLVKVMQVMLVRRVLPCQHRSFCMWEFNLKGPRTIQQFFSMTLEGMYGLFFGSRIKCSDTIEDAGLNCNRLDTQVSNSTTKPAVFIFVTTSF